MGLGLTTGKLNWRLDAYLHGLNVFLLSNMSSSATWQILAQYSDVKPEGFTEICANIRCMCGVREAHVITNLLHKQLEKSFFLCCVPIKIFF